VTLDVARGPRGRKGPQVVRGPHTEGADLALESLAVLAATQAQTVLPGHGEPWHDGVASAVEIARRPDRLAAQPVAKDRR
jgi:glyoxylase-like metal-dependent hydrolase (beta-lactamase superfamily II)